MGAVAEGKIDDAVIAAVKNRHFGQAIRQSTKPRTPFIGENYCDEFSSHLNASPQELFAFIMQHKKIAKYTSFGSYFFHVKKINARNFLKVGYHQRFRRTEYEAAGPKSVDIRSVLAERRKFGCFAGSLLRIAFAIDRDGPGRYILQIILNK
jgi:hypothetical protein